MRSCNIASRVFNHRAEGIGVALAWRHETVTYHELHDLTAHIAAGLSAWGIRRGDRVLLALNDTPATVACFLAALWLGAIPILLNPRSSLSTLSYVLEDSTPSAFLCEPERAEELRSLLASVAGGVRLVVQDLYPAQRVTLGTPLSAARRESNIPEQVELGPSEDAYWQYTSGTTGKPKAVRHHAYGMIHNTETFAAGVLGIGASDRVYSTAKLFFGYGLGNSVFFTLLNGATALLDDRWPTPALVLENIREFHPTVLFSVPVLYSALLERGAFVKAHMAPGSVYCSAGSQLPARLFESWKERFEIEVLDGIGATEMGHIFLCNRPGAARAGCTGKPFDGYSVRLLNEQGQEVPPGVDGVLWVRGDSISLGYHNRPSETAARFRDGWYRTGDVFVRTEDGFYCHQGREDDLFKVNGRWVAPVELETHVLQQFPEVREAAVVPVTGARGLEVPALCVVPRHEDLDAAEWSSLKEQISASFRQRFDSYKCPARYERLQALPKNDNGKLTRATLIGMLSGNGQPSSTPGDKLCFP